MTHVKKTIKRSIRQNSNIFNFLGFDPITFINNVRGLRFYFKDLSEIKKQKADDDAFYFGRNYPMSGERYGNAGTMSGHYFHQDLLVARRIFLNNPTRHLDVGSRIDGFVAHVAVFRKIEIVDIRQQTSKIDNILFRKVNLMQLPDDMINSCDSISSLHAIEHFGLGRYGDPIDYHGYLKGITNITKILKSGGKLYFSVPIGKQRIEFNAQRIFSIKFLLGLFKDNFVVDHFSFVDDFGDLHENTTLTEVEVERNFGCEYGCGIFELTRK